MKNITIFTAVLFIATNIIAQTNTFPSSGNVGIGTASPRSALHVEGLSGLPPTSGNTNAGRLRLNGAGNIALDFGALETASPYPTWIQAHDANNWASNFPLLLNPNGGNVGIGTSNPNQRLEVAGIGRFTGSNGFSIGGDAGQNRIQTNATGQTFRFLTTTNSYASIGFLSATIGNNYTDIYSAPANGLIVEGNVGIGTQGPQYLLDVNGSARFGQMLINSFITGGANRQTYFQGDLNATNDDVIFDMSRSGGAYGSFQYKNTGTTRLFIAGNSLSGGSYIMPAGNFGIGTTSPSEKLAVNGNIRAQKLIVTLTGWSDYVFEPSYKLRKLSEIETFIKNNKHLPEMPSAKEVEEKGISVGDNQALLLKKIEELTLYMIEVNKTNSSMQAELKKQAKEIQQLKKKAKAK